MTTTDITTFARLLVDALAPSAGIVDEAWWRERADEGWADEATLDTFTRAVIDEADRRCRVLRTGPQLVCHETMPDGSAPVRLSFAIKCF